jgi:hypothetical protein
MQHYMHFPMVRESSFKSTSLNQDFGVHGCLCIFHSLITVFLGIWV